MVCLHCIHLSLFKDFSELFERLTEEEQNEVNNCFNARGPRYFWPLFLQLACHLKLSIYHVSLTERLFSHTSSKVLVLHEPSNIEISKEKFQCLRPGRWLNDEVTLAEYAEQTSVILSFTRMSDYISVHDDDKYILFVGY